MVSARTQATLLLAGQFNYQNEERETPLDLREWNRFARWLGALGHTPEDLLGNHTDTILADWADPGIPRDRLHALLDRQWQIEKLVDQWSATGLWVLGRSDTEYPRRLKRQLRDSAPPLLYGYGNPAHFQPRTIGIVGSREATTQDLLLAGQLGSAVARHECVVVSGGARGVDDHAAEGALKAGGSVVVVLADSLVRNAAKKQYRDHLRHDRVLLMSPYSPDAGFSAGNAMGRNRLIYCLSDTAVAVSSANGKGGTFGGASQNLKHRWVPLWVARTTDDNSGNPTLVEQGAGWLPEGEDLDPETLFAWPHHTLTPEVATQNTLF